LTPVPFTTLGAHLLIQINSNIFQHQFTEDQAIQAATPLNPCYGEGPDFLHNRVKWFKQQLICLREGTNEIGLNSHPKQGFSLPMLTAMFTQLVRNQVDDNVASMTVGEDNISQIRLLVIRMAHSSPKALWPNDAKNGKLPATQEACHFVASVTAVGRCYKASSPSVSKKLTQQKLQWAKGADLVVMKDTPKLPPNPTSPTTSPRPHPRTQTALPQPLKQTTPIPPPPVLLSHVAST